ncbi:MAG TPA: TonB-dependent receptor plug domain-containing protein, partial [Saprospiraceae bacterium]|nr:TonB-dependent receptor plug domain-containing protein [Saprospiraceae bacterium]
MKKYIVILGLMLSNSWLFSQHEYPISNLKSLLSFLSEDSTFTFSYPADLENMQFTSILIKKSHRKDEIINIFERINLESKILNNHILLRPKQEQKSFELENEKIFKITVFDKISNEKIAWAAITTVLGTEERVYFTDDNGVAILPHNAKNIIVSQLGYESKYLSHLEDNQKIKIQPKPIALQTVEKKSFQPAYQSQQVEKSVVNYTQPFSNETVSPSSTKDVLAMVQMLPGINNTEERAGSIKIRGSNADGTNIFLNGIPVIQTGHYFELFSTINPLYVDKVELLKNNSPIYDLSNSCGAIYLSSKTLDRAKTSIKGDINLLTSSFNAFIPITPQFAITGAYRQNISDISNNSFYSINKFNPPKLVENLGQRLEEVLLRSSPTFGFYDTHMNASYKYKLGDFQASFFSIKDEYTNIIAQNQRINLNTNLFQSVMGTSTNNRDWQSLGYGLSSRINITSKFNTNIRWYSSSYDEDYLLQTTITPRTNLSKLTNKTDFSTDVKLSEISWMNQYQISSTTQWKAGVSKMSLLSLSDFSSTRNNQYTDKNELVNNTIFTQVQYQPTHYTMQSAVKLNWVANQMLIDWNALLIRSLENNVSLKFSASRSNQIMRRLN